MRWLVLLIFLLPLSAAEGIFITDDRSAAPATGTTVYSMTDVVPTEASKKVYLATSLGALTYTTQFDYTVAGDLFLEEELVFTTYISCDVQSVVRPGVSGQLASARAILMKDGTAISQTDLTSLRTCDGPSDVWEAAFPLDPAGTAFPQGSTLSIQLLVWAPNGQPGTAAQNYFAYVGADHPSGLTGPGLAPDVVAIEHGVFEGSLRHDVENHTMAYSLNSTLSGNQTLDLLVIPTAGSVRVQVSADGAPGFNATFTEAANVTQALEGKGNWTIDIAYEDFTGTVELGLSPPVPEIPGQTGEAPSDATGNATGNETLQETMAAQESPLPVLFAVLALLVAARRR